MNHKALIVYGARCVWWDSIDKAAILNTPSGHGLPRCPHCKGVLMQQSESDWWREVDLYERDGHPGYRKMVEWWRGKCFPNMAAMRLAYVKERRDGSDG